MKKLSFLFALMLCSIASMAQVVSFSGTMDEAFAKGKVENKEIVLLLTMSGG